MIAGGVTVARHYYVEHKDISFLKPKVLWAIKVLYNVYLMGKNSEKKVLIYGKNTLTLLPIKDKLQLSLAVGMFVSHEISLAKAAQLANKSLSEFMGILKAVGISSISYTYEMIDDDLHFANGGV
ncbi:hypothetical protein FACS1894132_11130 [Clostridia bacterium]|nr:hypothetical protein FACS1894132_11130 [Clostridia bacterium]